MRLIVRITLLLGACQLAGPLHAEEPHVSYIFPAGGQRGATVNFRIGGMYLHGGAPFTMYGPGVKASDRVRETKTTWFEGPIVPLPASQQKEDYPKDHAGTVQIAADASLGQRMWRVRTSQGVTAALPFVIGDLPEIVEEEIDGQPIPTAVTLPVTINGRIFPREDVDVWNVTAKKGETVWCEVEAARLGSPLDSRLEVLGPDGRRLAENSGYFGDDAFLSFTAPADGAYQVRIHDAQFGGLQHYVYRLTISTGPRVELAYPAGGRRGETTRAQLVGVNVPGEPVAIELPKADVSPAAREPGTVRRRVQLAGRWTNEFSLELGEHPEALEQEPNNQSAQANAVALPAIVNGRIDSPGDVDQWSLALAKDEEVRLDLRAARLGSPLDATLAVHDPAGKEIARADDMAGDNPDCQLTFRAAADGKYTVVVAEQFATRGGPRFIYRLSMTRQSTPAKAPAGALKQSPSAPAHDFRLTLTRDTIAVVRSIPPKNDGAKNSAKPDPPPSNAGPIVLNVERFGGFDGPIDLRIDGLPSGVTCTPLQVPAKQNSVQLTFKAEPTAKIGGAELLLEGTAEVGDTKAGSAKQRITRAAVALVARPPQEGRQAPSSIASPGTVERLALAVTLTTPFKFHSVYQVSYAGAGTTLRRQYIVDRNGYVGPLTISMADRQGRHLQGVNGPTLVVPADSSEFEYAAQLPPWLEIGRTSRSNIMAVGEIVDADGSRHRVSFTSQQQAEQLVALADPGPLSVTLPVSNVAAREDGVVVTVRVGRSTNLALPVRLELAAPSHVKGVTAEAVEVPVDQVEAKLHIRFTREAGPFNMPLTIRGTATRGGDRYVAEASLEVVK